MRVFEGVSDGKIWEIHDLNKAIKEGILKGKNKKTIRVIRHLLKFSEPNAEDEKKEYLAFVDEIGYVGIYFATKTKECYGSITLAGLGLYLGGFNSVALNDEKLRSNVHRWVEYSIKTGWKMLARMAVQELSSLV